MADKDELQHEPPLDPEIIVRRLERILTKLEQKEVNENELEKLPRTLSARY